MVGVLGMVKCLCVLAGIAIAAVPRSAGAQTARQSELSTATSDDEPAYKCKSVTGPVTVTFKPEMEVKDLVTWAMGFTCKSFLLDPRIVTTGRKLSLIVPDQLSAKDAYEVFLLGLSTVGLTVVPRGRVLRIVEAAAAKREALAVHRAVPGDSEQMVRVVIRPSYAQPEALRQAFTALKSDAGDVAVIGSLLLVTDYSSVLTGMMSLKKLVDVPAGTEGIYTIAVRNSDAAKLAAMLTSMFAASPAAPAMHGGRQPAAAAEPAASDLVPSKILVDERTNTLVLSASEPAYQRAKALVERIDIAVDLDGGSSIHAYQLSSAVAEELAQTLTRAITGDAGPQRPAQPQRTTTGSTPAASPAQPAPAAAPLDGLGAALHGSVRVVPDKATNKLLIVSSARDFGVLKGVIRALDEPRRQVYIEAMILEVDVSNGSELGGSFHGGAQSSSSSGLAFGSAQLGGLSSATLAEQLKSDGGLPLGFLGGLFGPLTQTALGVSIPSYGVLFQALATRSTTNILSMPSLIAVDNEEAKSKIGENIPYIKGTLPSSAGSETLTTNVDRQPLDLELNIKPHISANNTVLLEIKHSAGDIKSDNSSLGPTWTTRSVETRVVVRDQQTVLIGGLMQDRDSRSESKVPLLGDLPLLGHLFKSTTTNKKKTNLLILLTPYIIKDHSDLEKIRLDKLRESNEFFRSLEALDAMKLEPRVDYRQKRGVIEEINRAVQDAEAAAGQHGDEPVRPLVQDGLVEPARASEAP